MSKIAEKRTDEIIGEYHDGDYTDHSRHNTQWVAFKQGYDQAMQDIKQYVEELIRHEEKEWGEHNVDFGLYTILGHIVKIEENE